MKLNSIEQTMFIDNLSRNIWKKRKELRYSQEKLADKTGISAQYIYLLENGKIKNPGICTLLILCKFLGCTITDLIAEKETAP